jgi:hypothetical protein
MPFGIRALIIVPRFSQCFTVCLVFSWWFSWTARVHLPEGDESASPSMGRRSARRFFCLIGPQAISTLQKDRRCVCTAALAVLVLGGHEMSAYSVGQASLLVLSLEGRCSHPQLAAPMGKQEIL